MSNWQAGRQAEQLGGHGHIIINHISVSLRFSVSFSIDNQQGASKGRAPNEGIEGRREGEGLQSARTPHAKKMMGKGEGRRNKIGETKRSRKTSLT